MYKYIVAILIEVLASCAYANIANDILLSRTAEQKTQILSNIINSAGEQCTPIRSFFQGVDRSDAAYWNISCSNGKAYVVQIANDKKATNTIFSCISMKSLGAECFKRFGE